MNLVLCLVFIVMARIPLLLSMQAPAVAPELPEGWCNEYGTPTKTTGECICKRGTRCEGKGCYNIEGFIFYSGEKCPSCQCVPLSSEELESNKVKNQEIRRKRDEMEKKRQEAQMADLSPEERAEQDRIESEPDDDEPFSITAFIDDYGNAIIGVGSIFFVIVGIAMIVMISLPAVNSTPKPKQRQGDGGKSKADTEKSK